MAFSGLTSQVKGYYIESANLSLCETAKCVGSKTIRAYRVNKAWSPSTITWNNRASFDSGSLSSFVTKGEKGTIKNLNITNYIRNIANGSKVDYGIMLKEETEASGTFTQFYSSRTSTASYRPKLSVVYYDGPTAASSVTLASSYIKTGASLTVNWAGINSKGLSSIQYRIAKYDDATKTVTDAEYIPYANNPSIGTTASGSKTISAIASLPAGCYRLYVRGVDKGGIKGSGVGVTFHIDSSTPVVNSIACSPSTLATQYSNNATPIITWNASDSHFKQVEYSINGSAYEKLGTAESSTFKIPAGKITKTGVYNIKVRALDQSGNYSTDSQCKTLSYYYDPVAPQWGTASITPSSDENNYATSKTPIIIWSGITETCMKQVEYSINGSAYVSIGTSGTFTIPSSKFTKTDKYKIKLKAVDSAGNSSKYSEELLYYYWDGTPNLSIEAGIYDQQEQSVTVLENKGTIDYSIADPTKTFQNVTVQIQNESTGEISTLVQNSVNKEDRIPISNATLTPGNYKLIFTALDIKGNKTIKEFVFKVVKPEEKSKTLVEKRLGNNSNLSYESFDTPNGSGMIEESQGNLYYSQNDITLPNKDINYAFTRYYNSYNDQASLLGKGWDCAQLMQLYAINGSNDIWLKDTSGQYIQFTNSGATYSQKIGSDYKLALRDVDTDSEPDLSYSYYMTDKDKTTYYFNANGILVKMVTSTGCYLVYQYDTKGRLEKIVSNSDKTITFAYNDKNLLSMITLPDDTVLMYEYNGQSLLSRVLHKMNSTTKNDSEMVVYAYQYNENGLLSDIADAEGNHYKVGYSEKLEANAITYPNKEVIRLTYSGDGTATTIQKLASDANKTVLYTENAKFDSASGYVTSYIDALGLETKHEYKNGYLVNSSTPSSYQEIVNGEVRFVDYDILVTNTYDENNNFNLLESETKYVYRDQSSKLVRKEINEYKDEHNPNLVTYEKVIGENNVILEEKVYTYNEAGETLSEEDKLNNSQVSSKYSEDGSQTTESETLNGVEINSTTTKYDENGNVISESSEDRTTELQNSMTYDAMGNTKTEVDKKNRQITYTYDFMGRCNNTYYDYLSNPKNRIEEIKDYNKNGSVIYEKAKDGTVTTYQYDEMNRLTKRTITKGNQSETWYTEYGYETNIPIYTGVGNNQKNYDILYVEREYNSKDNIPQNISAQSNLVYTYVKYTNGKGQLVREQKNGLYLDYSYDDKGKQTIATLIGQEVKNAKPTRVNLTLYDKDGNQTYTIANPSVQDDTLYIDPVNTIVTESQYDTNGNVIKYVDANGNVTKYEYDTSNRVKKVILQKKESDSTTTELTNSYAYDITDPEQLGDFNKDGKSAIISTVTNAVGTVSKTIEDGNGRTLSVIDTNGEEPSITTTNTYNADGNVEKTIYSDGSYKVYTYENLLVSTVTAYNISNVAMRQTRYVYDKNDQVIAMKDYVPQDATSTEITWTPYRYTGYEYDMMGRKEASYEVNNTDAPTQVQIDACKIGYTYDLEGNLEKMSFSNNKDIKAIKYSYYTYKWLKGIEAVRTDGTLVPVREYFYDNNGKVQTYKDYTDILNSTGKYIQKQYTYDVLDRVKTMEYYKSTDLNSAVESYAYTYDKNSKITSEKISYHYANNKYTEQKEYLFDSLGQLEESKVTKNTEAPVITKYTYDNVGNRTSMTVGKETTTYTYNPLNQLISSITVEGTTSQETANISYTYDLNGNQIRQRDTVTGEITEYEYNIDGQLTLASKQKDGEVVFTQTNIYNGEGQRIQKIDNGQVTNYYYQDAGLLYTTDANGKLRSFYYEGNSDNVMATTSYVGDNATYYVYNKDIHGSITNLIDGNGESVKGYSYNDFGTSISFGDSSVKNELTYTGAVYDEVTGLYYMNARYYDSSTGRFLSQDSVRGNAKDENTWNLYTYCANDPINYVDPSGHRRDRITVMYYTFGDNNLIKQAKNSPFYKNKDVTFISINWKSDFISKWNTMKDTDILYIYLHGGKGCLYFPWETLDYKEMSKKLKKRKIRATMLFSCKGGADKYKVLTPSSVARTLQQKTGGYVLACTGGVSFSKINGKYYPRTSLWPSSWGDKWITEGPLFFGKPR